MGGGRPGAGLPQPRTGRRQSGALCPPPGRPVARPLDGAASGDAAGGHAARPAEGPAGRQHAPCRTARRRDRDPAGARAFARDYRLCRGQQLYPCHCRPAAKTALAAAFPGLGHRRPDPPCRRSQHPCHFRQCRRGAAARRPDGAAASPFPPETLSQGDAVRGAGHRRRHHPRPDARRAQPGAGLPHGGAGSGGAWRAGAGALCLIARRLLLQFLLPRTALHADGARSRKPGSAVFLSRRRAGRLQPDGRRAAASGRAPPKTSICFPKSSPAPARSTTCSGRQPSRSPQC